MALSDDHVLARLRVGGVEVASYVDGAAISDPTLSPRPFLHPVRTLGGTVVTDYMPEDHRWHLGISVAIQDVEGVNFWGGRTYVRDQGYVWRYDHGTQRHLAWLERRADHCVQELGWYAPDGRCLVVESRTLTAASDPADPSSGWVLSISSELHNVSRGGLALGSPATNGREGAGYGGLFWRLPRPSAPPLVFTATELGATAVHGSVAPWLAWVGDAGDPNAPFTLVLASEDPWFVRAEGYPGICSALAFHKPVELASDGVLTRRLRALVVDGALDATAILRRLEG